jgi:hypothetical protein
VLKPASARAIRTATVIGAAIAAVSLIPTANRAQSNELNVQFHAFQDTRSVSVLSPTIDFTKEVSERTSLAANFTVDAISAASDSCARCHRDGVNNQRIAAGLTAARKMHDLKLSVGGAYSREKFYRSTTLLTSLSRDFLHGNATLAAGYTFSVNQPILHPTQQIRNQYGNSAYLSFTRTLSKTTIAQAGYELGQVNGYQDNPFLRAKVGDAMILGHVPDTRSRHSLSARLRQALPADTYLEADFRQYFDSWQVGSSAVTVGASHQFTPQWLGRFSYRWYDQSGASFFQPQYFSPAPEFFTADFRLEPFTSGLYSGSVSVTPHRSLLGLPAGAALTVQYERYRADNGFDAAIFTAGVRVPLGSR